tara:strand:+ start:11 stop:403 length:393 start_codon:yes stop_codon:yes gene_type:complete
MENKICTTITYNACSGAHSVVPTGTPFSVLLALEPDQKSSKSFSNPLAENSKIWGPLSKGVTERFRRFLIRLQSKQNRKSRASWNHRMCSRASIVENCRANFVFHYFLSKKAPKARGRLAKKRVTMCGTD